MFPEGFYATTNLRTTVQITGKRIPVLGIEMDCGIVVDATNSEVTCTPLHHVRAGDRVVVGNTGVFVAPMERSDPSDAFFFMGSDVSTERPEELVIAAIAASIRQSARRNRNACSLSAAPQFSIQAPVVIWETIIRCGWIDVLFAGNALATHDIERAIIMAELYNRVDTFGTDAAAHGHEHHLRAINTVRMAGGIRQAVNSGIINSGIMHAAIARDIEVVLAGSIRDDGPLPDVITDAVAAQDAMRKGVRGVAVAIMVACNPALRRHRQSAAGTCPNNMRRFGSGYGDQTDGPRHTSGIWTSYRLRILLEDRLLRPLRERRSTRPRAKRRPSSSCGWARRASAPSSPESAGLLRLGHALGHGPPRRMSNT